MITSTAMTEETDRGTVGIDMQKESGLLTGGGVEVGIETIVTGETTLMKGHEDAARTLLTHGLVAEAKVAWASLQTGQKAQSLPRLVEYMSTDTRFMLMSHLALETCRICSAN
jgi:hypothetical protein